MTCRIKMKTVSAQAVQREVRLKEKLFSEGGELEYPTQEMLNTTMQTAKKSLLTTDPCQTGDEKEKKDSSKCFKG